jgi:hypothetical protein
MGGRVDALTPQAQCPRDLSKVGIFQPVISIKQPIDLCFGSSKLREPLLNTTTLIGSFS